jgi:MFS family permease
MAPAVTLRDAAPTSRAMVVAEHDLGGGLALQQWIIDGYLFWRWRPRRVHLGSVRTRPVMRFGLLDFGAGSVLAAVATSPAMLITARIIQGLGAAFLVPGSLALIDTVFDKAHSSAADDVWTGWTGTAFALDPLLGGMCVDFLGWRWIFVLSAIPMAVGYALTF